MRKIRRKIALLDEHDNFYPSVSSLSRIIGVHHSVIINSLNNIGYFEYKGIKYYRNVNNNKIEYTNASNLLNAQVRKTPSYFNTLVDDKGNVYESYNDLSRKIGVSKDVIRHRINKEHIFIHDNIRYYKINEFVENPEPINNNITIQYEPEYEEFKRLKEIETRPFQVYNFNYDKKDVGDIYAVALFSDAHIEETVKPESVLGLNEYNIDIATERIGKYFQNLALCLNDDNVKDLIFASLGDTISGFIHEELSQTNQLTPIEATFKAQSLIFSGLKFLCENTKLKSIRFIGIVGNHGRTTKKIQHSNGYKLSYEWLMYKNIEQQCKACNLPIEFCLPESELAVINTPDNKKFIFCHGFQIKSSGGGTVCGIYPSLNRLTLKWGKVMQQDKIYIGHFHQCVSIPNAVVNGSIIGYNSFALTNGLPYEEPAQMLEVYSTKIGLIATRKIYCK